MNPEVNRLARWQRLTLYLTGALLMLSGALWLVVHYSVGSGAGELPHPLESWLIRLHGFAAFVGLFMLGVLAASHVPHGWRVTRRHHWSAQRSSGVTLSALAIGLATTGYLLYYFAPEPIRPALGWAHTLLGLAAGILIVTHRRRKNSSFS
jgi:mannose/fructose/N-acetylgalactosamine-specific phosphotransferase system component IID